MRDGGKHDQSLDHVAIAGAVACAAASRSFDHLVGALLQEQRNVEAEHLGGLEVYRHHKFDRQAAFAAVGLLLAVLALNFEISLSAGSGANSVAAATENVPAVP